MSFVGFDLGNHSCIVAVARLQGTIFDVDVLLNDESKRETPAVVRFDNKHRFIGTSAASLAFRNRSNTVSQIKRLLGRSFSDPELKEELQSLPFKVTEGPNGYPLVQVSYLGEDKSFTPTELLGMLLSNLKDVAEKSIGEPVEDCCIGVPIYFTDLQRRAVMDAAKIAGLSSVRLLHETTAAALDYNTVRKDLPENEQVNVAFVDVGHGSTQVSIAGFKKGHLSILAHAFDRSLGGRDFDEVLFRHFAAKIKEEHGIDVSGNARASIRLRDECQKIKETLTTNPVGLLDIDSLTEEKDVTGSIKREEFEQLSTELLERLKLPLETALSDANLSVKKIQSFVLVGSGSRVPSITRTIVEFFDMQPTRTINSSECVARGCAINLKNASSDAVYNISVTGEDNTPE